MKVSDVVADLQRRRMMRNDIWYDVGQKIMSVEDVVFHLKSVDQDLTVIEYKIAPGNGGIVLPWLFIHVEGRKDEGSRANL